MGEERRLQRPGERTEVPKVQDIHSTYERLRPHALHSLQDGLLLQVRRPPAPGEVLWRPLQSPVGARLQVPLQAG